MNGYQQALSGIDPSAAIEMQQNLLHSKLYDA